VVDAGGFPPPGGQDNDDPPGSLPEEGPTVSTATGSHSVAVYSGVCTPSVRASRVYVPIRSTLMTPNNASTICSANVPGGLAACRTGVDFYVSAIVLQIERLSVTTQVVLDSSRKAQGFGEV
jgi:hypothetical protein